MLLKGVQIVVAFAILAVAQSPQCRILPTDSSWPAQDVWDAFNSTLDGRLIKTVPIGSPCHDPTFDEAQCKVIQTSWRIPSFHQPNPSSIMDPNFLNKSCDPFDPRDTPCRIGAYVQYAVNVSSPEHVIKTIQFVKKHNIRFVVKNTGHDYMGRSTGTGAVSVWMHNLQNITWIPEYRSSYYTGPGFKVHAGVLGIDLAKEASRKGLVVVSGECPTVGFAGGYIQGGGHSALSSVYGLAADQTLEFEVITADGQLVHASPTENEDLYWALSGGGGGTYGIVWSVTIRPHQDLPVSIASLNFTSEDNTQDVFWQALNAYQASTLNLTDYEVFGIARYTSKLFSLYPIFAVNKTSEELSALLKPLLNTLDGLGVKYVSAVQSYPGYIEAYSSISFLTNFPVADALMSSRLLPRSLWEDVETLKNVQKTIRAIVDNPGVNIFENVMKAIPEAAGYPQNAVLPAWRKAERHFVFSLLLEDGESMAQMLHDQETLTRNFLPAVKSLTPGSGSYLNEADPNDPDFKDAFYGPNYNKLLAIKDKWDPDHILYGSIAVGGDRWRQTEEGRLCRSQ
ncbi:hypothetical protein E1B28_005625 [Marasmius oreades]|uniref:FAD-binding PCMH-type domain-containing protein n=1 Tax=Marasmius oreades TaxID=181124 RepID=A0A9P7S3V2_9AGAR|nr:uncharacterized protein E1B28_005625 [Marasmius oreades]KAG7094812.1 hypothetical protein E1B28_005625 [Marasmius oreades]